MSSSENETISLDHIHREPANPGEQLSITGSRDLLTAAIRPPRSRIIKIINSTARNEILKTLLHSPTRFIWLINTMSIFDLYSKCEASEKISFETSHMSMCCVWWSQIKTKSTSWVLWSFSHEFRFLSPCYFYVKGKNIAALHHLVSILIFRQSVYSSLVTNVSL